jgi:hypothetical protein
MRRITINSPKQYRLITEGLAINGDLYWDGSIWRYIGQTEFGCKVSQWQAVARCNHPELQEMQVEEELLRFQLGEIEKRRHELGKRLAKEKKERQESN